MAVTIGGGGNMVETTKQHVDSRHAYLLICGVAVIAAFFSTLTVLALASRAFAFYYTLQCLVAFKSAKTRPKELALHWWLRLWDLSPFFQCRPDKLTSKAGFRC